MCTIKCVSKVGYNNVLNQKVTSKITLFLFAFLNKFLNLTERTNS